MSMESATVEILKADSDCLLAPAEDCPLNFSAWMSGYSDSRNGSHDEGWEQERMPPIIPIITAVYSVVFVVGLLGNCLVMYVIVR